jgi:tripartite-type tricarboxylate transporter receptor subunit TctC
MRTFIVAATLALAAAAAGAQQWPARPIKLLVGFAAGGPTDQVARVVAQRITQLTGQSVVVENRPGANGAVATREVIGAPPDGYTLLVGTSGALTVSPSLLKQMPYEPLRDLTPVAMLAGYPYLMVVPPNSTLNDVKDLVAFAKANPDRASYSSAGVGSVNHLAGEWFANIVKVSMTHVPYKGDSPALADLMTGRLLFGFNTVTTAGPQVKAGKLRALGVTSEKRTELAPGIPTLIELGYPGFVVEPWNGILGTSKMPREVIDLIKAFVKDVRLDPAVKTRILETGQYPIVETSDEMRRRIEQQTARWREIARAANVQPE